MNPLNAARIPARRRLFPPKARRVRHIPQRQRPRRQYLVAVHIRYRHLCRGQQPQVILVIPIHRVRELGQIAIRRRRFGGNHIRQVKLLIPMLLRMRVKHPVYQRPLQPRPLAAQREKARPRHLGAPLKIYDAQPFAQLPMRQRLKVKLRRIALHSLHHIIAFVHPRRNIVRRHIRNAQQQPIQLRIQRADSLFQLPDAPANPPHLIYQRLRPLPRAPDLAACLIAPRPQLVRLHDCRPPPCVHRRDAIYRRILAPPRHRLAHVVRPISYKLNANHSTPQTFYFPTSIAKSRNELAQPPASLLPSAAFIQPPPLPCATASYKSKCVNSSVNSSSPS